MKNKTQDIIQTLGIKNMENDPAFSKSFYENMKKAIEEHNRIQSQLEQQFGEIINPENNVPNWENVYQAYINGYRQDLMNIGFTLEDLKTAAAFHIFTEHGFFNEYGEIDVERAIRYGYSQECAALGVEQRIIDAWELRLDIE